MCFGQNNSATDKKTQTLTAIPEVGCNDNDRIVMLPVSKSSLTRDNILDVPFYNDIYIVT